MIGISIFVSVYLRIKKRRKQKYGAEPWKQMNLISDLQEFMENDEDEDEQE